MNRIFRYLLGICLVSALFSCSNKQIIPGKIVALSDLPPVNIPAEPDSVIEIKDWLAIGPFEFNSLFTDPAKTFFREDLKRYKIKEGRIDSTAIEKLQRKGVNVFLIDEPSPQIKLFKYIFENVEKKSNFYLISRIHSAETQDVTLVIDGSNSYAIWLNGDKQIEVRSKYNTNKASDRFVNVSLKKGENTLFAKVNRGSNKRSWDLICTIAPRQEAERIFRVNYAGDFVVNPIVDNSLEVYAGSYQSGRVEIRNDKDQIIAAGSFDNQDTNDHPFVISDLGKLEEGFYKATLTVDTDRLEEMIYKGDYQKFAKKIKTDVNQINNRSLYAEDLKAALQRVDFLNDQPGDPKSPSETRFLNRNRVFWGYSLYNMLHKNALTQLMTYKNQEDDSGVFIFHKGGELKNNIPLVIIVPSALQGNSMIEDWYTSNLDQIETDNALADEHGFAVAWIYAGGRNYSEDKTEKEIAAVINRLHSDYNIDDRKIFIMGDCEGGRRALIQLAKSPDRYVACAVDAPITLSEGGEGTSPIDLLPKMGNVPIMIRHGVDDDVSPVENARAFYAEAKKLNMPVEYIETKGSHKSLSKDNHRFVFEFFSGIESKQE